MFVAVAALMAGSIGARNLANIALVFEMSAARTSLWIADRPNAACGSFNERATNRAF